MSVAAGRFFAASFFAIVGRFFADAGMTLAEVAGFLFARLARRAALRFASRAPFGPPELRPREWDSRAL